MLRVMHETILHKSYKYLGCCAFSLVCAAGLFSDALHHNLTCQETIVLPYASL